MFRILYPFLTREYLQSRQALLDFPGLFVQVIASPRKVTSLEKYKNGFFAEFQKVPRVEADVGESGNMGKLKSFNQ